MTVRITFSHKNRSDHVSCKHKIFHWCSISRSQQTLGLMQWLTGSEFFFLSLITTLISASSQALLPPPTGFLSLILYPPAPICPGVWSCLYLSYSMALSPPDLYSNVDYPGNPFWNCTSACQHTLILSLLRLFSLYHSLSTMLYIFSDLIWFIICTLCCVCVCVCVCVSCSVVSHSATPMDYSPPGFSVHGVLQARILEWVATAFSRGSSQPRDQTHISCIAGIFFTIWAIREAPCCGQCKIHMYKHTSILLICWIRYIQNSVSGTK